MNDDNRIGEIMFNKLDARDRSLAPVPSGEHGVDKIIKFDWSKPKKPGMFMEIDKHKLNLDSRYQRDERSHHFIISIARNWDWSLFGAIKVARREDGTFWVFDGGHRTRASFYRSDITKLPCMVFSITDISDEAKSFVGSAKLSNAISSFDTFRAAMVAEEPIAIKTDAMLKELGIVVKKGASQFGELACVASVQYAVDIDELLAKRTLELLLSMSGDSAISAESFKGLFCLARHFKDRDIFLDYADEWARITQKEIDRAIRDMKAEVGKGGQVVMARGILSLLNKGKKTRRLVW